MELEVKLPAFEGPLELLLHLIDKDKINIYDIPIVEITDQYLDYVANMEAVDLDLMSDFLVMAATLLDIKSRMLLPVEETDEEDEEDPRSELVRRLLEYRKYKYLSAELKDLSVGTEQNLFRGIELPEEVVRYKAPVDMDQLLKGIDMDRLRKVFEDVMGRVEERTDTTDRGRFGGRMEREVIPISERIIYVKKTLRKGARKSFRALLSEGASKTEIIVTFLAILELMKTGDIHLTEDSTTDDFTLEGV